MNHLTHLLNEYICVLFPYNLQENIQSYLKGCVEVGIPSTSLFNTIDLYEEKNINNVCILYFYIY